jgi:hypothetical protein
MSLKAKLSEDLKGKVIHCPNETALTSALLIYATPCSSHLSSDLNNALRLNPVAFASCSFGFTFLILPSSAACTKAEYKLP